MERREDIGVCGGQRRRDRGRGVQDMLKTHSNISQSSKYGKIIEKDYMVENGEFSVKFSVKFHTE